MAQTTKFTARSVGRRVLELLFSRGTETELLRFVMGLVSLASVAMIVMSPESWEATHPMSYMVLPQWLMPFALLVYAISALWGAITHRYSTGSLFTEAMLGMYLYIGLAAGDAYAFGALTPSCVVAFMSWVLFLRYPTHSEQKGRRT